MLHNVMNSVTQRENGYEPQYDGCYSGGFTPYPTPSSGTLPTPTQRNSLRTPLSGNNPQATLSAAHQSILSQLYNVTTTTPVYGPSLPTPYPLFVDVTTGAPMRLSDIAPPRPTQQVRREEEAEQYRYAQRHHTETALFSDSQHGLSPSAASWQPPQPSVTVGVRRVPYYPPTSATETKTVPHGDACSCEYCSSTREAAKQQPTVEPASPPSAQVQAVQEEPSTVAKTVENDAVTPARPSKRAEPVEEDTATPTRRSMTKTKPTTVSTTTPTTTQTNNNSNGVWYNFELTGRHPRRIPAVGDTPYEEGAAVIIEGDRGIDLAFVRRCTRRATTARPISGPRAPPTVLHQASEQDVAQWKDLHASEREALEECQRCVTLTGLGFDMSVVNAVYQFDKQKLTFYYQSKQPRVDFRKLLNELFTKFRCRIWMDKDESEESTN